MQESGIILVNKPRGISSNAVVNIVKKAVGANKAGHLGTLDVAGEGLLPVTLNKATKLFDYFLEKDKEYITVFKFGQTTDTLDLEGKVTCTDDTNVTREMLEKVLPKFIGKMAQMPPQYSAKKINGQKAYDLARRGETAELKPKEIEIYDIKLLETLGNNTFKLRVHCSSGTYIRSLVRDVASELSTYGVMQCIQRTKCGQFDLKDSFSVEEIKNGNYKIIKPENVFSHAIINLDENQTQRLLNGVKIRIEQTDGVYRAFNSKQFLGLVIVKDSIVTGFKIRLI